MYASEELSTGEEGPNLLTKKELKPQAWLSNADLPHSDTTWYCSGSPVSVVDVIDERRDSTTANGSLHYIQVRYRIRLEHVSKTWEVVRSATECKALWRSLANTVARVQNKSYAGVVSDEYPTREAILQLFPRRNTAHGRFAARKRVRLSSVSVLQFLRHVTERPLLLNHAATSRFFDCTIFSFFSPNMLAKNSPDVERIVPGMLWDGSTKRWFFACDSFYGYLSKSGRRLLDVQLVDGRLGFQTDIVPEKADNDCTMTLSNLHRDLQFRMQSRADIEAWREYFNAIRNSGQCEYAVMQQPNHSFAPVRDNTLARWYVCGRDYMKAAAHTIEKYAKEQIFITDWWLSPEVMMCRPEYGDDEDPSNVEPYDHWRLDRLLQRKAEQGVRVYVLVYKEVDWAMGLNSLHTKTILQARHENIKVIRHPDHWFGSQDAFMWSHHEKTICIDQKIAFVGGIDLCFGRWEFDYRLVDMGTDEAVEESGEFDMIPTEMFDGSAPAADKAAAAEDVDSGIDSSNNLHNGNGDAGSVLTQRRKHHRDKNFLDGSSNYPAVDEKPDPTKRKRKSSKTMTKFEFITMPFRMLLTFFSVYFWQAFAVNLVGRLFFGKSAKDQKKIGKRRTTSIEADTTGATGVAAARRRKRRKRHLSEDEEESYNTKSEKVLELLRSFDAPEFQESISKLRRVFPGKDYYNELRRCWAQAYSTSPFDDYIDRKTLPRMPWQDIAAEVLGASACDAARHFIERWNAAKVQKKHDDKKYPFLVPKPVEQSVAEIPKELLEVDESISDRSFFHCRTQVLRSCTQWSAGVRHTEDSIQQAYLSMIQAAQKFIYIENQFFVTFPGYLDEADQAGGEGIVMNCIGEAIVHRIRRAHDAQEDFHIYIVVPLLPAIEGKFGTAAGAALSACVHYIYSSINRPPHALFERLKYFGIPVDKYITFSSLRTHGLMGSSPNNTRPVTEIIYVHSKLLIVDDFVTIIGSANINDRSMIGARDSEVCVLYRDRDFFDCGKEKNSAGGISNLVGGFAGSLRRRLWSRYLNIEPDDPRIQFPGSLECRKLWSGVARNNTGIYRQLFGCVPCDTIKTYQQLNELDEQRDDGNENVLMPGVDAEAAKTMLKEQIIGYLVEFPLQFLAEEDLMPVATAKERVSTDEKSNGFWVNSISSVVLKIYRNFFPFHTQYTPAYMFT